MRLDRDLQYLYLVSIDLGRHTVLYLIQCSWELARYEHDHLDGPRVLHAVLTIKSANF